jgi:lysophospholipase L1-like esterase
MSNRSDHRLFQLRIALASLALLFVSTTAAAAERNAQQWIATWAASPQQALPGPEGPVPAIDGQTVRQRVRVSAGGTSVRVRLSNEFGKTPLAIGSATVALPVDSAAVQPGTLRKLTFGGRPSVVIPPGAPVLSDPVQIDIAAGSDLAISLYCPQSVPEPTLHLLGLKTAAITPKGDFTDRERVEVAATTAAHPLITAVLVPASKRATVVVALGDSITDGTSSTVDTDQRWPDFLAQRLTQRAGKRRTTAVVNAGISGNQLLRDGAGISALARFDRDVLSIPGVTHVVVLEATNDIGWPGARFGERMLSDPATAASVEDIIGAYRQLIDRAHAHGLKIYGGTLLPFEGVGLPGYHSAEKEKIRLAVNDWIRTGKAFDAVIDFDAVIRDPEHPARMLPRFDSGDHLHPGDEGYKAMGMAIDLALFD